MAATWKPIFHLPTVPAGMVRPSSLAMPRSPVMANSRARMMKVIHAGARLSSTSEISAPATSSLSASGSRSLPSVVTCFQRRAR